MISSLQFVVVGVRVIDNAKWWISRRYTCSGKGRRVGQVANLHVLAKYDGREVHKVNVVREGSAVRGSHRHPWYTRSSCAGCHSTGGKGTRELARRKISVHLIGADDDFFRAITAQLERKDTTIR